MNRTVTLLAPILLLCGWQPALAQEYEKGQILEAEVSVAYTMAERRADGADALDDRSKLRLLYLDRIDEVKDGQAVRVTRHFRKARVVDPAESRRSLALELEGRQVVLARDAKGKITAAWAAKGEVAGRKVTRPLCLHALENSLWPAAQAEWGVERGSRKGTLARVSLAEGWSRAAHPTMPGFFHRVIAQQFLYTGITKGRWKVSVKRKGTGVWVSASLKLEGEEVDPGKKVVVGRGTLEMSVKMKLKPSGSSELPGAKGPPPPEQPAEDGQ